MDIKLRDIGWERIKTDLLAVPVTEESLKDQAIRRLNRLLGGKLAAHIKKSKFSGATDTNLFLSAEGSLPAANLLLLGMGKEREVELHTWRVLGATVVREAAKIWADDVSVLLPRGDELREVAGSLTEGAFLSRYKFTRYRSNNGPGHQLRSITLARPGLRNVALLRKSVASAEKRVPGIFLARDLVNEPPSIASASYLAEQAQKRCHGAGLRVEVWGKRKIQAMNLAGLLAVNRGSRDEPRFITIRYRPRGNPTRRVALIGKGVTFDSGGLSLKSPRSMETMKHDMAGAAAIIGAMSVLPELDTKIEVNGFIPTTDNLPSGSAQKPGDVIRYMNGKTVEVMNTDAEGRLILADALLLAAREKPDCMINLATLTGACIMALGNEVAGIFSNNEELAERLIRCGRDAGEKFWQLPLVKEYREDIHSTIADIKNVGGGSAGAITAALFLQEFVGDTPWAHMDIAGPAFTSKDYPTCPKGGTGFGAQTLLNFLAEGGR